MKFVTASIVLALMTSAALAGPSSEAEKYWPTWRGPERTGMSRTARPPVEWSESKNIKWKVDLRGEGHASPIIWKDRVYVLTAASEDSSSQASAIDAGNRVTAGEYASMQPRLQGGRGRGRRRGRRGGNAPTPPYKFNVVAINRADGSIAWTKTVRESKPHEAGHATNSQASNSPVTDGKHVYAYFGSRGLYCLDMDGNLKWSADFGEMQTRRGFGEGSSPALHGDTIVVNWDHEGDSFIVALDKSTGKEKWRKPRDEPTSWSTPLVVEADGKAQVIVSATNFIRAYDLETGDEIWRCGGMTTNAIPSPVESHGIVILMSGFRGNATRAIRYKGARGDITGTDKIAWTYDQDTPYVPSPMLYGKYLYFTKHNKPILTCFDAKNGKPVYTNQRLEGLRNIYASPVGANGHVYISDRDGTTNVFKTGPKYELVAKNVLDDEFDSSPALAGSEIYLRGRKSLYCIAEK